MDTFSNEEKVSKNFLINGNVDVIIDIVDASNLDRNLYLTTQLKQFNKPIILVLNMIDVAENKGIKINYDILSKELNVKVIPIIASKGIGIDKLIETLENKTFLNYKDDNDYNFKSERDAYKFIGNIIEKAVTLEYKKAISNTDKIDKIVLNPVLAYPLFLGILYIIFKFTFNWVGTPLADYIDTLLNDSLIPYLGTLLESTALGLNLYY